MLGEFVTLRNRDPRPPAGTVEQLEQIGALDDADAAALEFAAQPRDTAEAFMDFGRGLGRQHHRREGRSEEHTSELQSLMRISYAVFCLKKKKQPLLTNTPDCNSHTQDK